MGNVTYKSRSTFVGANGDTILLKKKRNNDTVPIMYIHSIKESKEIVFEIKCRRYTVTVFKV
jgi:hypothetical protein